VALSSAIKAGLSLGQSLKILAEQCPRPICQEFRQIVGEFQLGKPLEQSLTEARDRLKSENFALFSAAMLASRESGGRLNETVERIAHSVMEMQRVERRVISETAQARTSALYMALAPLAVLLVYYLVIDRVNTERLFTTLPGQLILCTSLIFNILAYLWARAILNPDI
jgi:tight adherence protein B